MGAGGKFELKRAPPPPYKAPEIRRKSCPESIIISEEDWEYETESEHEEAELGRHVEIEDSVVDGEIIEVSRLFRLISD